MSISFGQSFIDFFRKRDEKPLEPAALSESNLACSNFYVEHNEHVRSLLKPEIVYQHLAYPNLLNKKSEITIESLGLPFTDRTSLLFDHLSIHPGGGIVPDAEWMTAILKDQTVCDKIPFSLLEDGYYTVDLQNRIKEIAGQSNISVEMSKLFLGRHKGASGPLLNQQYFLLSVNQTFATIEETLATIKAAKDQTLLGKELAKLIVKVGLADASLDTIRITKEQGFQIINPKPLGLFGRAEGITVEEAARLGLSHLILSLEKKESTEIQPFIDELKRKFKKIEKNKIAISRIVGLALGTIVTFGLAFIITLLVIAYRHGKLTAIRDIKIEYKEKFRQTKKTFEKKIKYSQLAACDILKFKAKEEKIIRNALHNDEENELEIRRNSLKRLSSKAESEEEPEERFKRVKEANSDHIFWNNFYNEEYPQADLALNPDIFRQIMNNDEDNIRLKKFKNSVKKLANHYEIFDLNNKIVNPNKDYYQKALKKIKKAMINRDSETYDLELKFKEVEHKTFSLEERHSIYQKLNLEEDDYENMDECVSDKQLDKINNAYERTLQKLRTKQNDEILQNLCKLNAKITQARK